MPKPNPPSMTSRNNDARKKENIRLSVRVKKLEFQVKELIRQNRERLPS